MSIDTSRKLEARPSVGTEGLRWGASLALVLGLHVALVWVMLSRRPPDVVLPAEPEAIMLALLPEPASAQPEAPPPARTPEPTPPPIPVPVPPAPEPPAPEQPPPEPPFPEPLPPEIQATPPVPQPEAVLPLPPVPHTIAPPPPPPRPAPVRRAPPPPTRPVPAPAQPTQAAPPAAAPPPVVTAPPPPSSPGNATLSWRADLVGKLARAKRYPEAARTRGEQGTAMATFTMDRAGHVLSASVTRGSGSYLLDEEAVALIHRAEPLPAVPPEMPGATLTLTVPIAFALR